ncbi:hypothetical protein BDY21DRAFT_347512 [Lineolata rhizophorae]|uniref:ADF-H domain-containing protein n=1 Tax=Lineolata rhizophorae TaxID=578093 RepID=A0A6A6NYG8_9PEZI|nr:hypothetical protein BDY21DRAFT_347512 [Lineolata rhizophorae]
MQSGISASEELRSTFLTFLSDPSLSALLVTISDEQLVPQTTLPSAGPSFSSVLSALAPHLKPDAPLYVLARQDAAPTSAEAPNLIPITYVPDAAPVRAKMLFASTRLTLTRELGSENFVGGGGVFATSAAELTPAGWAAHEASEAAEKPLTSEEKDLEGLREAEASESAGTGVRRGYSAGRVEINVGEGVVERLSELAGEGTGGGATVQLKINVPTESIELVPDVPSSIALAQLPTSISSAEPRYTFYKHVYTPPESLSPVSAVIFIYTCPSSSSIKERMLYASSRRGVLSLAETESGVAVAKKLEASTPDEISAETIQEEFQPRQETKTGFAKPKRPGRR